VRKVPFVIALCLSFAPSSATAAQIAPGPPATYPSGTSSVSLEAYSGGGGGEYGWLAYKLPADAGWHRCLQGPVNLSLTGLTNGTTYSVLVADDLNKNWLAANGLFYSGISAACDTTDLPNTPPTSYTFTVAAPPVPVTTPTPPTTAPVVTPAPVIAPTPSVTGSGTTNRDKCISLKADIHKAQGTKTKATKTYRKSPTKSHKKALDAARRKLAQLTKSYLKTC
jgi:hypothetical protein